MWAMMPILRSCVSCRAMRSLVGARRPDNRIRPHYSAENGRAEQRRVGKPKFSTRRKMFAEMSLPGEVGERLVGVGHAMHVFAAGHCHAFSLIRGHQLFGQFLVS